MASRREGDELLTEQRRSYDRQVEKLEQIDTKVARTVRITAIVVGVVVATARVTGGVPRPTLLAGGIGLVFLLTIITYGMYTFGQTRYRTRVKRREFSELVHEYDPTDQTHEALREMYRDWTSELKQEVETNEARSGAVQLSLLLGVTYLTVGGGLFVALTDERLYSWFQSAFPVTVAGQLALEIVTVISVGVLSLAVFSRIGGTILWWQQLELWQTVRNPNLGERVCFLNSNTKIAEHGERVQTAEGDAEADSDDEIDDAEADSDEEINDEEADSDDKIDDEEADKHDENDD